MYRLLTIALPALALLVIIFGAYVRLSDAGLGCPDWPGCYGHLGVPSSAADVLAANQHFDRRPVEAGKAWREMIHRYLAAGLGLGILSLAGIALTKRRQNKAQPVGLTLFLVMLVIFQGMLGMWTVTLLLKPLVVVAHLLGGLAVLALLWWHYLCHNYAQIDRPARRASWQINAALVVLIGQIFLGGWTSSNYAALACTDFPSCHDSWWPSMDFLQGFTLWRGLGVNYEYGVLETPARTAIHYSHRLWAVVTAVVLLLLAGWAIVRGSGPMQNAAWCIILALSVQLILGIMNVTLGLPLIVAVAHNGGAALLLISVITLKYFNNYKAR